MADRACIGTVFAHTLAYGRNVLRGIRRYVEPRPQWLLSSFRPEPESLRVPARFRPDGVIASVTNESLVRPLEAWACPVVDVAMVLHGLAFPRVGVDNLRTGQLAATHLLERGLRQFGFLGSPDCLFSAELEAAFVDAVQTGGYTVSCYDAGSARGAFCRRWDLDPNIQEWLRALSKPVGVFVPQDLWGVQAAEACRRAELRVPQDVALLGVGDDDLHCDLARPPLSSIILPAQQIGYEAAALVERLLDGDQPPSGPMLLPPLGVADRRSTEVLAIDDQEVIRAVRFIRRNAHRRVPVVEVAQHLGLKRRTLERRCRAALGWGIGEEIQRAHLELARRLLAETDLPLKLLAPQAGFRDFRLLCAAFRSKLGATPTLYRRQMQDPALKNRL
jgi:LacI family transcriptional regulator